MCVVCFGRCISSSGYSGMISLLSVVLDARKVASLPNVTVWTPSLGTGKYFSASHSLEPGLPQIYGERSTVAGGAPHC